MPRRYLCKRIYLAVFLTSLLAAVFAFTANGLAAPAAGRIAGALSDPSGAVVPGGKITVGTIESGLTQTASSDQQGGYVFDGLPAGRSSSNRRPRNLPAADRALRPTGVSPHSTARAAW